MTNLKMKAVYFVSIISLLSACSTGTSALAIQAQKNYNLDLSYATHVEYQGTMFAFMRPYAGKNRLLTCIDDDNQMRLTEELARQVTHVYLKSHLPHKVASSANVFDVTGLCCAEMDIVRNK